MCGLKECKKIRKVENLGSFSDFGLLDGHKMKLERREAKPENLAQPTPDFYIPAFAAESRPPQARTLSASALTGCAFVRCISRLSAWNRPRCGLFFVVVTIAFQMDWPGGAIMRIDKELAVGGWRYWFLHDAKPAADGASISPAAVIQPIFFLFND